jgi:pimeloyl-ACP methyl ester carboxylesterase
MSTQTKPSIVFAGPAGQVPHDADLLPARRRRRAGAAEAVGIGCFCGDLPEEEQQLVYAARYAPAADLFLHNAPGVAWRTKPSWAIVATDEQTVQPDLERDPAKRMGATTYDIDSSHVPMLSHPDFVLDVIRAAAAGA